MNTAHFGNNRGFSLFIAMTIVVIVIIIILPLMTQAVNERQAAHRLGDSIRAFYAAESGINDAIDALNSCKTESAWTDAGWNVSNPILYRLSSRPLDDSDGSAIAYYDVEITDPAMPTATVEATGYAPDKTNGSAVKSVRATIQTGGAAVTAKGSIDIRGNAEVTGGTIEYGDLSFENIFDKTKDEVKAEERTEVVTDPANDYTPVPRPAENYTDTNMNGEYDSGEPYTDSNANGKWDDKKQITWFKLVNNSDAQISSNSWTGEGIIIVEDGDLRITGGTFNGVIWVMGTLFVAGNPTITGAIYVDGTVEDITTITGTPVITFDKGELVEAFGGVDPLPFKRASWREIYE